MTKRRTSPLAWGTQKELWERWKDGSSLLEISRLLMRSYTWVRAQVVRAGGIEPRVTRRRTALTGAEREEISRGIAAGWSLRRIARQLCRAPSTIQREVRRHARKRHEYRARSADRRAWRFARRPKPCKLECNARLRRCVAAKLKQNWSPEQIARWLRATFPTQSAMHVSHETIYKTLFIQARGALKKELVAHLRTGRKHREPRGTRVASSASIVDGISIRQRPAEANDRAVPGHWEGDLLFGSVRSYIATLVERKTRFCMLVKVSSKDTKHVTAALQKAISRLPKELRRSLTWDRGSELSAHADFSVAADIQVYFCDPSSPWQRGSNENTNGLLRQYFPHGKDVSHFTQAQLDRIARELNGRPRMTLDWKCPAEVMNEELEASVALTN